MLLCLREPPRRFLWCWLLLLLFIHCCCRSSFIFVLHLSMFFIHICFLASSLTLPWTIDGFLHPFYNFSRAYIPEWFCVTFIFNHSVIFLPRALRFWLGIFLPMGAFCLTLLHWHFTFVSQGTKTTSFIQGFLRMLFNLHYKFIFRTIHI